MSFSSAAISRLVHVIDLADAIDPLAALVIDRRSACIARRLDHPVLRWRTRTQMLADPPALAMAWGERAFAAARDAAWRGLYRPGEALATAPAPSAGWQVLVNSQAEASRFAAAGWAGSDLLLVRPPGIDGRPGASPGQRPLRSRLGIRPDDFIWLLPAEANWASGLREASWATAVLRALERDIRAHRLLLHGDSAGHDRARRFVQQLGLPGLAVLTTHYPYHDLTAIADAALLLPQRPSCAWSAAVAAYAGLPAVISPRPILLESFDGATNVRVTEDDKPRVAMREMLRLSQALPPRAAPAEQFAPEAVRRRWQEVVESQLNSAIGLGG